MLLAFSGKGPEMVNVIQGTVFHKGVPFLNMTGILLRYHLAGEPGFGAAGFPVLTWCPGFPCLEGS